MKSLLILIVLIVIIVSAQSQIQYLRYNDNFNYLKSDSISKKGFQRIKFIPISQKVNVSFGGEIREQLQYYKNINFGDVPLTYSKSTSSQLWHRLMVHTNIEVGKKTRLFAQLGSTYRFLNPNPLTPEIEQNELSLHQAFIDYHFNKLWLARIGRQEISYGNHRLITFREGPNTRLTFDAAIFKYNNEKRKVDVFAISPVIAQKGAFDDQIFKDLTLGIYATEKLTKKLSFDYFLLHFHSTRRQYNFIVGSENRKIVGFRLFTENPKTNCEVEVTYQFGKFNKLLINAYGISADINHKIVPVKSFIIGLSGNYITGDKTKSDNQLNTYNLLYSKPQYGLTAPVGATNIITVNPYLKLKPTSKSNVYLGTNLMWRQSSNDGTYTPGAIQIRPKPEISFSTNKRKIGTLVVLETSYSLNDHFSFAIDASRFIAGNFTKETGKGKSIYYSSFKISYKL
jgi:hypothetical protein